MDFEILSSHKDYLEMKNFESDNIS